VASVRKDADGDNWLALATKGPPKTGEQMDQLRDEIEILATQFGGDYDGWEASNGRSGHDKAGMGA